MTRLSLFVAHSFINFARTCRYRSSEEHISLMVLYLFLVARFLFSGRDGEQSSLALSLPVPDIHTAFDGGLRVECKLHEGPRIQGRRYPCAALVVATYFEFDFSRPRTLHRRGRCLPTIYLLSNSFTTLFHVRRFRWTIVIYGSIVSRDFQHHWIQLRSS